MSDAPKTLFGLPEKIVFCKCMEHLGIKPEDFLKWCDDFRSPPHLEESGR